MAKDPPLFAASVGNRLRASLRAEFGYTDEMLATVPDDMLGMVYFNEGQTRRELAEIRASLPEWIKAGHVTQAEVSEMSTKQLMALRNNVKYWQLANDSKAIPREANKAKATIQGEPVSVLTRGEAIAMLAQVVAVMAAQQEQINELRNQLATVHNTEIAVFGKQQVVEQLTSVDRDLEGVDITMRLEELSTLTEETSIAASEDKTSAIDSARNASAAIEGLASLVAGFNAGGTVNLKTMETAARRLKERTKLESKVRSKGEVTIRIGKVTRSKS